MHEIIYHNTHILLVSETINQSFPLTSRRRTMSGM